MGAAYLLWQALKLLRRSGTRLAMPPHAGELPPATLSSAFWTDFLTNVPNLIGVIPESEIVLQASNSGTPVIAMEGTPAAEAHKDVIARLMGEECELRFTMAPQKGSAFTFISSIFKRKAA